MLPVFRESDNLRDLCWVFVCMFWRLEMSPPNVFGKMKSQLEFQFPERWSLEARSQVGVVNSQLVAVPLFWCSEDKHPGNFESSSSHTPLQQRGEVGHLALLASAITGSRGLVQRMNFMCLQDLSSTHQPKRPALFSSSALLFTQVQIFHSSTDVSQRDKSDHCAQWMEPRDS